MASIQTIRLSKLKNDMLTGIMRDIERIVATNLQENERDILAPFSASLNAYVETLRTTNEKFGDKIQEADAAVDKAWSTMNAQINAFCAHPNPDKSNAGKLVSVIFERYPNPTRLAYAEEYGIMEKLIRDLDDLAEETLVLIALDEWLPELKARVKVFSDLTQTKTESKASINIGATKRARIALEDAYNTLIAQINALLVFYPDEAHNKFASELNTYIDAHRSVEKARKTAKSNAASNAEEN